LGISFRFDLKALVETVGSARSAHGFFSIGKEFFRSLCPTDSLQDPARNSNPWKP
jgi:hypothetical protein